MKSLFIFLLALWPLALPASTQVTGNGESINLHYPNNRYPLVTKPYMELPLGSVRPQGWLKNQLSRMCNGMTGRLDSIYPQVMGRRNGWLGGDGDVWERGPYWIDGLLPLAYIMNDQALIEKVRPWIESTLASQKPDGYFGPDTDRDPEPGLQRDNARDWWPKMVMLKVMQQYYSATGDKRTIDFLTRYFKYQLATLPQTPLGHWTFWGEQRGGDNLMVVYWLYNLTGDSFLLDLGELIHKQTFDWTDVFLHQDHLARPNSLHCVNLAQGFKEPVIYYQQSRRAEHLQAVETAVRKMRHTIGFPTGLWAGDELLRFGNPTQGSELCTAVEMMFSLEKIVEITGNVQWADHLEKIAYNVLPTQIKDDFSARQYYQQVNQIAVTRESRNFVSPHEDTDIVYGELSGYPCCTSNLHQGWPKFTQHLWYATADNGIASLIYAPSEVTARVGADATVSIKEETQYPFEETIRFELTFAGKKTKEALFPFHLRVPAWCRQAAVYVNEEKQPLSLPSGQIVRINRIWKDGDQIRLELPMEVTSSRWYEGAAVIERGPLLYALKMNEKWEKKTDERPHSSHKGEWYYEVTSDSPWNYCLQDKYLRPETLADHFKVKKAPSVAPYPWTREDAPVSIQTQARLLYPWKVFQGSAGPICYFLQASEPMGEEETIELIPYGCTTLRITEFPVR